MLLRVLIVTALLVFILLGIRKIYRDWTGKFRADDRESTSSATATAPIVPATTIGVDRPERSN
jgi:hypothetical protein